MDIENKLMFTGVGAWVSRGEINWELGINIYTLTYINQVTNKDLLYSSGNSTKYCAMAYMGKHLENSGYMSSSH